MLKRIHRWFATPAGIVTIGIALLIWTYVTIGWPATWRLALILAALGAADIALGAWSKPLSLEVYWSWRRDRRRYLLWWVGILAALVGLHAHFTGLG